MYYLLRGVEISMYDDTDHTYLYTVCANGENCEGESVMAQQINSIDDCWNIGMWMNGSIAPSFSSENNGKWEFIYNNGK